MAEPTGRVIEVIEVTFTRGKGVEDDPIRIVHAYFDLVGTCLAERDPVVAAARSAVRPITMEPFDPTWTGVSHTK